MQEINEARNERVMSNDKGTEVFKFIIRRQVNFVDAMALLRKETDGDSDSAKCVLFVCDVESSP